MTSVDPSLTVVSGSSPRVNDFPQISKCHGELLITRAVVAQRLKLAALSFTRAVLIEVALPQRAISDADRTTVHQPARCVIVEDQLFFELRPQRQRELKLTRCRRPMPDCGLPYCLFGVIDQGQEHVSRQHKWVGAKLPPHRDVVGPRGRAKHVIRKRNRRHERPAVLSILRLNQRQLNVIIVCHSSMMLPDVH